MASTCHIFSCGRGKQQELKRELCLLRVQANSSKESCRHYLQSHQRECAKNNELVQQLENTNRENTDLTEEKNKLVHTVEQLKHVCLCIYVSHYSKASERFRISPSFKMPAFCTTRSIGDGLFFVYHVGDVRRVGAVSKGICRIQLSAFASCSAEWSFAVRSGGICGPPTYPSLHFCNLLCRF